MSVKILIGDVRVQLREMPEESVHCVVTSPPYWGLRCYGVEGQIGQEPTLGEHVEVMVEVFREVRRVLRKDGTVWLNYGDCYATGAGKVGDAPGGGDQGERFKGYRGTHNDGNSGKEGYRLNGGGYTQANRMPQPGLKPKDLCMMPARVALALQADGWWLRSEIIWHKPNPMPESITDRPTSSHEKIYLLAKSQKYYFDADAVREKWTCDRDDMRQKGVRTGEAYLQQGPVADNSKPRKSGNKRRVPGSERIEGASHVGRGFPWEDDGKGRNIRNVWTVATAPFPGAHFATFPPALIEPCIKAGCPEGGTVLDPFGGAGTTGLVADRLKRNAILIELNPEYAAMARARIQTDGGMFAEVS